ncbi:phage infection protein [Cohnella kolymensis]|uniref:Phage infection protein n=1 Tax=Cohnella kolymensis TaxID=1590652 RepID=A0ABR5A915_9BACL|nr:YhgE/Pip domain-containing protein [Cohnella kolymensis]KIL37328.1 phage infection protein [Cohnella kolymensis]
MKGIGLVFKDWKALLHHKHGRIALGFLVLVPLIYAGFFLAGYWDPYDRLDQLPVAVVNMDKGSALEGKAIHAGEDFVGELQKNRDLDFHFVSAQEAEDGLQNGRYYMTIIVPESFSREVGTLMDEHPTPAQLIYKTNAGKNFVASQVGATAVKEMRARIDAGITKSYADGVFSKMQELAQGFSAAGDGAKSLNEGTVAAKDGLSQLANGIHRVTGGASELESGGRKLAAGEHKLQQAAGTLADGTAKFAGSMQQFAAGHQKIEAGSSRVAEGMKAWVDGSKRTAQGEEQAALAAKSLSKELAAYVNEHPDAANDEKLRSLIKESEGLASAVDELAAGQSKLTASAEALSDGQKQAVEGMQTFGSQLKLAANGAKQLSSGSTALKDGFAKWDNGFQQFAGGVGTLANGGQRLDSGAEELMNGLVRLSDGSGELSGKLNDAAKKTSGIHSNDSLTSMFAEPVQLVESKVTDVPNYGSGIAPYFLCLAFWVGGIMAANILPLGRKPELQIGGTTHFVNKLGLFYSVGLIQTAIVDTIVLCVFKLHVTSVPRFLLFTLLVSFTFLTLVHMLVSVLGMVGKFAAVTLLILQLATCGGTFPMELNAPIMRAIGECLPMTYALRGLQHVIALGNGSEIGVHALILLGYLAGAAMLGLIANLVQSQKHGVAAAAH